MKKVLFIIFLVPFISKAQSPDMKLENNQVYFEKIYQLDSMPSKKIERLLAFNIPKTKDLTDFLKSPEIITAKLRGVNIDYKKYGGTWVNTPVCIEERFSANVSIVWKDNKYRVTVTNIYFYDHPGIVDDLSTIATVKKGTELGTSNSIRKTLYYIDSYIADLFRVDPSSENW